jgi:hypothetical protein
MPSITSSASKQSKSNDALNIIGQIHRQQPLSFSTTSRNASTQDEKISFAKFRMTFRFLQATLGSILFLLLCTQDRQLLIQYDLLPSIIAFVVLTILIPLVDTALLGVYFGKWMGQIGVKQLLLIESSCDLFYTLYHLGAFILFLDKLNQKGGGNCYSFKSGCDVYNWTIAFTVFGLVAWSASLLSLIYAAIFKQRHILFSSSRNGMQRLNDHETEIHMRSLRMQK